MANQLFTIDQLKEAHAKVKSGADFPAYIQEIKSLGVSAYENYVSDGVTVFYGKDGTQVSGPAKYPAMEIMDTASIAKLQHHLLEHQQGQTDYFTFCKHAAEAGVERWKVSLADMTCTYSDKAGNDMLTEAIPS